MKMAVRKCTCGREYEDLGFKTLCPSCFAKQKNGNGNHRDTTDIHRQVFLKVASEQKKGCNPEELIEYARLLEESFNSW